jgi:HEAT repeat protein
MGAAGRPATDVLVEALRDNDAETRAQSASAVPALVEALGDENEYTLEHVVHALGAIGKPSRPAVSRLKALLKHEDDEIREAAEGALEHIEG